MNNIENLIKAHKLIAVLTIEDENTAVPIAKALCEGGVKAIELTLRTATALESIRRIIAEVPEMTVSAGTVLEPKQVKQVIDAGAHFAVAPGCSRRVLEAAKEAGLAFAPGIMTPSDIEKALEYDCKILKFFPAGTTGGIKHLEAMSAPYNHLGVKYIPLGGVNVTNFASFVANPLIAAVGGSWLATPAQVKACDCEAIKAQALEASSILKA
ncbi:MAG: bifunctional 4-hydroxy-2-oxoglutarate aldolase/2-dehydro-3-deoxy-phosphogluconate aldolase [Opitutales bacterium]